MVWLPKSTRFDVDDNGEDLGFYTSITGDCVVKCTGLVLK